MTKPRKLSARAIRDELKKLGSTSRQVATNLKKAGVKGWPRMADSCPVARYLQQRFALAQAPLVYPNGPLSADPWFVDYACVLDASFDPPPADIAVPAPVAAFLEAYDEGRYAFLQEQGTPP